MACCACYPWSAGGVYEPLHAPMVSEGALPSRLVVCIASADFYLFSKFYAQRLRGSCGMRRSEAFDPGAFALALNLPFRPAVARPDAVYAVPPRASHGDPSRA